MGEQQIKSLMFETKSIKTRVHKRAIDHLSNLSNSHRCDQRHRTLIHESVSSPFYTLNLLLWIHRHLDVQQHNDIMTSDVWTLTTLQWIFGSSSSSSRSCFGWGHKQPGFHHHILKSLEIFELFIRWSLFPSIFMFVFVVLCCGVCAVYYAALTDAGFTFLLGALRSPRTIIF